MVAAAAFALAVSGWAVAQEPGGDRASADPAAADRLWGRVTSSDGTVREGFLRWDRNEGSWVDILDGRRVLPEVYREDAERLSERQRSVEAFGVRVTWDAEVEWSGSAESGVRFGHVRRITVAGGDSALVELRSGERVALTGGASDVGSGLRGLELDGGEGGRLELDWEDLATVELAAAPPGAVPSANRLHGTVEDRDGRSFTGYLAWGRDAILDTDHLEVEVGDEDQHIPFAEVTALERQGRTGLRVSGANGEVLESRVPESLRNSVAVDVSDPVLGLVAVPWGELRAVRFHPPERPTSRADFVPPGRLRGTVRTDSGAVHSGWIRWDNDEARSWEILDGRSGGVDLDIELGHVVRIVKRSRRGAAVTLRDGRTFEMEGSNDVNQDHKGVFVTAEDGTMVLVDWWQFREADFDLPGVG